MDKNKVITRNSYAITDLHVRETEAEGESRIITGYAILFDVRSAPLENWGDTVVYEKISRDAITKNILDASDIKMTMFHDRQLILARSRQGNGSLSYKVDEKGVYFEFEAPNTVDGNKALELIRRGDISGCSFAFSTKYYNEAYVDRNVELVGDVTEITYTVKVVTGIYDFTLAADPAYPDTSCEAERELAQGIKDTLEEEKGKKTQKEKIREQIREIRAAVLKP